MKIILCFYSIASTHTNEEINKVISLRKSDLFDGILRREEIKSELFYIPKAPIFFSWEILLYPVSDVI